MLNLLPPQRAALGKSGVSTRSRSPSSLLHRQRRLRALGKRERQTGRQTGSQQVAPSGCEHQDLGVNSQTRPGFSHYPPGVGYQSPQLCSRTGGETRVITTSLSSSLLRKTTFNSPCSAFLHCEVVPNPSPLVPQKEKGGGCAWLLLQ